MNVLVSPDRPGAELLVVGSVNEDRFTFVERFPLPGETVAASAARRGLGGKGANQAVAAARAGAGVVFVAMTGADAMGAEAVQTLRAHGVRTDAVGRDPQAATGTAAIAVDANGENWVIVEAGANARLGVDEVERAFGLAGFDDGSAPLVLTQGEVPIATIVGTAALAERRGARFVLNLAPVVEVPDAVLRIADPLIVNEHEAAMIAESRGSLATGGDLLDALSSLARSVVITLGAAGAVGTRAGERWTVGGFAADTVVDTTGAGDAFVGSLCARLAHGAGIPEAMAWACAAASLSVGRPGAAESYADAAEVDRLIAGAEVVA